MGIRPAPCKDLHPQETRLAVRGMTCQHCVGQVTAALYSVDGVASAEVQLAAGRASVHWKSAAAVDIPGAVAAVQAAGFSAQAIHDAVTSPKPSAWSPLQDWRFNVVTGALVTCWLMLGEWILGLGQHLWFKWLAFALVLPVQILCGARFYRGAWSQLKLGRSNMDTLVALGSTTAFTYSTWALFMGRHEHLFFLEAAAILTLISLGHWLEVMASDRAAGALKALLNLAPQTARKRDAHGLETAVAVAELQVNDTVVVKPGDRVPTDGEVIEGASAVDESMLTGEARPIEKVTGAILYAGTLNQNGRLIIRVTAIGSATALAAIIAVVQRAQNSRARIQRLGDQVSNVFVPVVVGVALVAAFWWGLAPMQAHAVHRGLQVYLWPAHPPADPLAAAVLIAASVLIIACPCAMGLATPAAIMAGTNAAARRGLLVRDGPALEKTGNLTSVVFDKTGTLTLGKLTVGTVADLRKSEASAIPIHQLAVSLAKPSNHPLSQAVAKLASSTVPLTDWQEFRGLGVQARGPVQSGQALLQLGSLTWLRESGVDVSAATTFCERWGAAGASILGLAADLQLIAVLELQDRLKPRAAEVLAQLKQQGKAIYLITGDNPMTAGAIARQVGISQANVFAQVRPDQKADLIKQLQQRGERVAFVGDGINDAPALEQADLGIAVSQASDAAREAADIILLNSDIQAIPEALGLAQATLRTIKQNLFWAFAYNAAAVPLAALGFLSPILCAAAMGLSDLIVLGNSLRLQRWKYDWKDEAEKLPDAHREA